MNTLIETIAYKGYNIEVHQDECAESPDVWGNTDCFIVYDHRDFCVERKYYDPNDIFEAYQNGKKLFDGYYFFPVYAYIHSGVALSLGRTNYPFDCRWDTSFKGFALVKRTKGWSYRREKAYQIALCLIEEWNQYLSGDVYGYNSEVGSCWGFYGDTKYMISEAKSEIDSHIQTTTEQAVKQHAAQIKQWAKNHVPLQYRTPLTIPL
jgi:hypothetical protein